MHPWYVVWMVPFLCVAPSLGVALLQRRGVALLRGVSRGAGPAARVGVARAVRSAVRAPRRRGLAVARRAPAVAVRGRRERSGRGVTVVQAVLVALHLAGRRRPRGLRRERLRHGGDPLAASPGRRAETRPAGSAPRRSPCSSRSTTSATWPPGSSRPSARSTTRATGWRSRSSTTRQTTPPGSWPRSRTAFRAGGLDVVHLHRRVRTGFKAGALADGLTVARGEFVAIFDADFVPPPGFLQETLPYFEPDVAVVQARWGHLNRSFSALTVAQALGIDGHFAVEQSARAWAGLFLNFNGTGGIWRRAAILDAGGWAHDTVTEDLDLSYRAQLRGWRIVYRPDIVCPAELPVLVTGFKSQQRRWAKGSIQTAIKLLPAVLAAPRSPVGQVPGLRAPHLLHDPSPHAVERAPGRPAARPVRCDGRRGGAVHAGPALRPGDARAGDHARLRPGRPGSAGGGAGSGSCRRSW